MSCVVRYKIMLFATRDFSLLQKGVLLQKIFVRCKRDVLFQKVCSLQKSFVCYKIFLLVTKTFCSFQKSFIRYKIFLTYNNYFDRYKRSVVVTKYCCSAENIVVRCKRDAWLQNIFVRYFCSL